MLEIQCAIVVADALHCNQKAAKAVIDAGANYLFVIKDNVPKVKADIELYIQEESVETSATLERNGSHIEKRTAYFSAVLNDWTGVSIIRIYPVLAQFIGSSKKALTYLANGTTIYSASR